MIQIQASLDRKGCLKTLEAKGHANTLRGGYSPVCAGVTTLLRTGAELFLTEQGIKAEVLAPQEGVMEIRVLSIPEEGIQRSQGLTDFLIFGLQRLALEAPDQVTVRCIREEGDTYGT
ncbi:MAG: ribosomal-processing cysteine protease Prp [Spirochaetales bacterium]